MISSFVRKYQKGYYPLIHLVIYLNKLHMNFTISFFQFSTTTVDSFCAFVFQYISKHAFKLTLHAIRSCCNFVKVYINFQINMQSFCRILVTFWYIWYPRVLLNFSDFLLSVDIQYISIYHFFTERWFKRKQQNSGSKIDHRFLINILYLMFSCRNRTF